MPLPFAQLFQLAKEEIAGRRCAKSRKINQQAAGRFFFQRTWSETFIKAQLELRFSRLLYRPSSCWQSGAQSAVVLQQVIFAPQHEDMQRQHLLPEVAGYNAAPWTCIRFLSLLTALSHSNIKINIKIAACWSFWLSSLSLPSLIVFPRSFCVSLRIVSSKSFSVMTPSSLLHFHVNIFNILLHCPTRQSERTWSTYAYINIFVYFDFAQQSKRSFLKII